MKRYSLSRALFFLLTMVSVAVQAGPWTSPPETLVSDALLGTSVATNASGASVTAWIGSDNLVYTATRAAGVDSPWLVDLGAVSPVGKVALDPVIAINDNGDAALYWENSTDGTVDTAFRPAGGSWTLLGPVATGTSPRLSMNNEIVVGAWLSVAAQVETITFKIEENSFGVGAKILSDPGAANPQVAVSSDSSIVVVWEFNETTSLIQGIIRNRDDAEWKLDRLKQLSNSLENARLPAVRIDGAGDPVAVWRSQLDGAEFVVQGAIWQGVEWSEPSALSSIFEEISDVQFAMNDSGVGVAVWLGTSSESSPNALVYAAFLKDKRTCSWTQETLVSKPVVNSGVARVGIDALGNAIVAWCEADDLLDITIQTRYFIPGGAVWLPSIIVTASQGVAESMLPSLSVGSGGNAALVWLGSEPEYRLLGSYFAVAYPPLNMTAERKSDRFLGQKDLYNILRGNNYPGSAPVSYSIYRADGTSLVQTVPTTDMLKFEEHNRRKGVLETYQVVSNNTNGGQSFPYTITVTK